VSALLEARTVTRALTGEIPVTLVDGVSLEVARGEFVAIMGPSGSGKSSLLYLLGLLDIPSSGSILLDGEDTSGYGEEELANTRLAKLGFVFQFHFLLAEFSALENILLPIRRLGRLTETETVQRGEKLLGDLGLKDHIHKKPQQMSGGQRQRVAVARALANDPLLILADEPTGNLDTASSSNVRQILKDLTRSTGKSVIAVTHDPDFAAGADRCIGIVDGRIDPAWVITHKR
jgi:lipoprotein-releasing system ATP-binding protein